MKYELGQVVMRCLCVFLFAVGLCCVGCVFSKNSLPSPYFLSEQTLKNIKIEYLAFKDTSLPDVVHALENASGLNNEGVSSVPFRLYLGKSGEYRDSAHSIYEFDVTLTLLIQDSSLYDALNKVSSLCGLVWNIRDDAVVISWKVPKRGRHEVAEGDWSE